jgi:SIR2-like domain
MPAYVSWGKLVERLETESGVMKERALENDLIQRALRAVQVLRREGQDIAAALRRALYSSETPELPAQSLALASIFWPLLCTTNYDDIYLRAKLFFLRSLGSERNITMPRLYGRSETDCRRILQQLNFPDGEVIWAVQGLVASIDPSLAALMSDEFNQHQFREELVIGHVEYRKATHRAPHFRRCFTELFRTRSLLFLGSGLTEHYFRSLFDEIIELTGPPPHPHFALVPEDALDPQFMRQQYLKAPERKSLTEAAGQSGCAGVKLRQQMAFVGKRQGPGDEERGALCSGSLRGSD